MESKFAIRIFLKTNELVYLYKGVYAEIPFGECPETYIDDLINKATVIDYKHNYKSSELSFISAK